MKTSKFSESQIIAILGCLGKDKTKEKVCQEHELVHQGVKTEYKCRYSLGLRVVKVLVLSMA